MYVTKNMNKTVAVKMGEPSWTPKVKPRHVKTITRRSMANYSIETTSFGGNF